MNIIGPFQGEYRFLSNFYPAEVHYDGVFYPTVEHAYQAAKTLSLLARESIKEAKSPGEAKKLGYKVPIRRDWEELKLHIMRDLVFQKFFVHDDLRVKLLETGNAELQEINTWGDTYWGVCNGVGENNLGKILMDFRDRRFKQYYFGEELVVH